MNSTVIRTLNCIYLNVLPEYGGRGIAKTLVKMSEKVALQKNAMFMQVRFIKNYDWIECKDNKTLS